MTAIARTESLVIDVAADGIRLPIARARVADAARVVLHGEGVRDALVSITFVSRGRIATLNRTHLGHAGATDVISFGFRRPTDQDPVVGDIYICPDVARATAASLGVPAREEITRLVVHGTLHILGHEHPDDDAREDSPMWAKQEGLVRRIVDAQRPARKRGPAAKKRSASPAAKKAARKAGGAAKRGSGRKATGKRTAKPAAKRTTARGATGRKFAARKTSRGSTR